MTSLLDKYIYWITRVASWVWKVIDLVILVTFLFADVILFVIRAKEIDFVFLLCRSGRRGGSRQCLTGLGRSGEGVEFARVGLDMLVPACAVGSCGSIRDSREHLEDVHIGLRWRVPSEVFLLS